MSNEELVALIQDGDREQLPQLWASVERFGSSSTDAYSFLGGSHD